MTLRSGVSGKLRACLCLKNCDDIGRGNVSLIFATVFSGECALVRFGGQFIYAQLCGLIGAQFKQFACCLCVERAHHRVEQAI